MTQPLVSILIPCYNAAEWISDTLDSALAQTWPTIEIIVINDGSTDASPEILAAYASKGVKIINQPNAGQSAAFNRGISIARGEYLEFLDADDLIAPDKIAVQMARLAALPSDTIASGEWGRFTHNVAAADFRPDNLWTDLPAVDWLTRAWLANNMMHGAAYLIPTSLVRRAGGWCEHLSLINDFEFFSRVMLAASQIAFCPGARTYYRSGLAGSVSQRKSPSAWQSAFDSISLGTTRLLAFEDSPRTRRACAAVWRVFVHDSYPRAPALEPAAIRHVQTLGEIVGSPEWGPKFRAVAALVGWRTAKRMRIAIEGMRG